MVVPTHALHTVGLQITEDVVYTLLNVLQEVVPNRLCDQPIQPCVHVQQNEEL